MSLASRVADHVLYAQPLAPVADLRDFLDARYGFGGWSYRTGVGLGTDCQLAAHDALDALRVRYGRGKLLIPPTGSFRFTAGLDAAKLSGHVVEGLGSQATILYFDAGSGALFPFSGAGGYTGGGLRGLGVLLEDGRPTSNAVAIRLDGDASFQQDQSTFEDLYISAVGSSYWYDLLVAAGTERTSPQGIRIVTLKNIQLFRGRNSAAQFYNCVGWTIENLGTFAGTGGGSDVYISGGGSGPTNTTQMDFRGLTCSGTLSLSNATKCVIYGQASAVAAATSFNYHAGRIFSSSFSGSLGPQGNLQVIA